MKVVKNIFVGIGVIILAWLSLAIVATMVSFINEPEELVSPAVPSPSPETVSQSFRDAYMEGCNEDGLYEEYCSCTYSYIDTRTSDREFMNLSLDYVETDILPEMMVDAFLFCSEE